MRVDMPKTPGLPALEWGVLWRVSTTPEKLWDLLCLATVLAATGLLLAALLLGPGYAPTPGWDRASTPVGESAFLGLMLLGNQSHRRMHFPFGLRQTWPMALWMTTTGATFLAALTLPHVAIGFKLAVVAAWLCILASYWAGWRGGVELKIVADGVASDGQVVPWHEIRYFASHQAITLIGPGRKLLGVLRLAEMPAAIATDLEAELSLHATAL